MAKPSPFFDVLKITDPDLDGLRTFATMRLMSAAPALGQWVRAWAEAEQVARRETPDKRDRLHKLAAPIGVGWSGKDLGEALWALTTITYSLLSAGIGSFFDHIMLAVVGTIAAKLEKL